MYFLGKNVSLDNSIGFTIALRNLQSVASEIATLKLQFPAATRVTFYFSPWSYHEAWTYHLYYLGISSRNYGTENVNDSVKRLYGMRLACNLFGVMKLWMWYFIHSVSARRVYIPLLALFCRMLLVSIPVLCGRLSYTIYFRWPHKKVSGGERFSDLGVHSVHRSRVNESFS